MYEAEESSRKVECLNCGTVLPSDWGLLEHQPCPKCGSDCLRTHLQFADRIVSRDLAKGKVKDPNYKPKKPGRSKKPSREFKVGTEPQKGRPGKWACVYRDINRERDTYDEKVVDEETGKVLNECHEPLSVHTSHGSAKRGTREDKGNTC